MGEDKPSQAREGKGLLASCSCWLATGVIVRLSFDF